MKEEIKIEIAKRLYEEGIRQIPTDKESVEKINKELSKIWKEKNKK